MPFSSQAGDALGPVLLERPLLLLLLNSNDLHLGLTALSTHWV